MYEPLSGRAKILVKWSTILVTVVLVIVTTLAVGLVGKNITYTARLTPPSQRQYLDDAFIYYYSQISMIALGLMLNISLVVNSYVALYMSKRRFRINLIILTVLWLGEMVVTIAFITGGSSYQNILKTEQSTAATWNDCTVSLCGAATCARINAYKAGHAMAISYAVIGSLLGVALLPLSFLINSNRIEQLQLLEK